jgi:hypothetical protein
MAGEKRAKKLIETFVSIIHELTLFVNISLKTRHLLKQPEKNSGQKKPGG